MANQFSCGGRVRVIASGATGKVEDPGYVYGGVLIVPDKPERPWAPLTPYLPSELELIPQCPVHGDVDDGHFPCGCKHPESERQALHHNGLPVELCRACRSTCGFAGRLAPAAGFWGEWMPGLDGWASAPAFSRQEMRDI